MNAAMSSPVATAFGAGLALHLFATALLVGFMAVVQWSLVPAQNRLDGPAYATLEQGMNRVLERLTPALMITALATGGAATAAGLVGGAAGPVPGLLAAATTGIGVMVVSTLLINAPVNAEIDTWDAAVPPTNWRARRDRWEAGHAFRSYVGLAVLTCSVLAAVWPT